MEFGIRSECKWDNGMAMGMEGGDCDFEILNDGSSNLRRWRQSQTVSVPLRVCLYQKTESNFVTQTPSGFLLWI